MQTALVQQELPAVFTDFCEEAALKAEQLVKDTCKSARARSELLSSWWNLEPNPFRSPAVVKNEDNRLPSFANGFLFGFGMGTEGASAKRPRLAEAPCDDTEYDPYLKIKVYVGSHSKPWERIAAVREQLRGASMLENGGWDEGLKDERRMELLLHWGTSLSPSEWAFAFSTELDYASTIFVPQPMPPPPESLPTPPALTTLLVRSRSQALAEMALFNLLPKYLADLEQVSPIASESMHPPLVSGIKAEPPSPAEVRALAEHCAYVARLLPKEISCLLHRLFHMVGLKGIRWESQSTMFLRIQQALCKKSPRYGELCIAELKMLCHVFSEEGGTQDGGVLRTSTKL
eukprot:scaffold1190_cov393-Prasinococcus_capsulatus_cf.AAC.42